MMLLGWCTRLPEALSPSLSPSLSLFLFPFVGWCARLPEALSLFPLAYLPSPFLFPFVGWSVRLPESLSRLSPSLCASLSSFLFPFVGRCVRLPTVLSLLSPSLSSSLFPSLPPSLSPSLSLPCSPAKIIARRELCRLESSQSSGIENDVSSFTFILRFFSTHPIWQSYAAWFERLEPTKPIGCFLVFRHLALQQSKRSRTK